MKRKAFTLLFVLVLLLAGVSPASAISYGGPDGNAHPYVGSMVLKTADGSVYQICSGTLVAPQVFLTASHCTVVVDQIVAQNPGSAMVVTFDPSITPTSTFYPVTQWVTNPAYIAHRYGESDPGDVAVGLLAEAPAGITPAQLPTQGLLDQMKASHVLDNTTFTAVGYGTIRLTNHTGPQGILDNMDRNQVDQQFLSLTDAWVTFSMNYATDNGGTCYGDSGGPHFVQGTNLVVAVTVTGDAQCKATDKDYRVDTPQARAFLGQYVTLP